MTHSPDAATLRWAHRGVGTDVWLRVDSPVDGRLVARTEGSPEAIDLGELSAGTNDVTLSLPDELAPSDGGPANWTLAVRAQTDEAPVASANSTGSGELLTCLAGRPLSVRITSDDGRAVLKVSPRPPWAEVEDIQLEQHVLRIRARVVGHAQPRAAWLDERDGATRTPATLGLEDDVVETTVDLERFVGGGAPSHHNLVLETDDGAIRFGGHLDDVPNKGRAIVPRPLLRQEEGSWWTVTPRFTDRNNVVVTVSARKLGSPPDLREAWDLDPADLLDADGEEAVGRHGSSAPHRWLRRLATLAFAFLARRGRRARRTEEPGTRRQIHLLIASIHAMGGTIRATINTANALAADPDVDVSLTVVYRLKEQQFFAVDPRVRTTVLVDEPWLATQRSSGPVAWLRGLALEIPSLLIPADDPRYYRFSLWHDMQLLRWLRTVRSGTIVTTRAGLSVVAASYARRGVRIVAQQHVPFGTQTPELRRSLLDSYRAVDAVTVLTAADEAEVRTQLAGSDTQVRRVPNALYDLDPPRSPLTAPRILCGGRFTPAKGMDLLVEAFARVADERPEWELRVYGSARRDRLEALREMVRRHGLEDRVLLMAPTDHLELEMSKASVCAVPSRHEAFGMMIIEAMRCGLPVVAFDCPVGPGEIITDGHDGLLVPPEDVEAFADRLLEVTGDADLRARLADRGLETAAMYSPDRVAATLLDLIDELAAA